MQLRNTKFIELCPICSCFLHCLFSSGIQQVRLFSYGFSNIIVYSHTLTLYVPSIQTHLTNAIVSAFSWYQLLSCSFLPFNKDYRNKVLSSGSGVLLKKTKSSKAYYQIATPHYRNWYQNCQYLECIKDKRAKKKPNVCQA